MDKVTIVFWSQSGNTESMANAVAEGVTAAGKEAVVVDVASASLDDLKAAKGFAMGCPAMGAEVLEEGEMALQQARRSHYSVLMAGATDSGCVTG